MWFFSLLFEIDNGNLTHTRVYLPNGEDNTGYKVGKVCKLGLIFLGLEAHVKYGVRSPKFIWALCAQLYSLTETSPPPPHLGSYTRAPLVSQDGRHLFVTPGLED
jgi:hypothetical protein